MPSSDYCVPVHLNQAVVFDLLAIVEDGFAHVSTIKTAESSKNKGEAGVGATNVFALLGISLKTERGAEANREVTQERVHTPVSLFAKVRRRLHEDKVVHDLTTGTYDLMEVRAGTFVELEVTLRRNPLAVGLEAVVETIRAIGILTSFGKDSVKVKAGKASEQAEPDQLKPTADHSKRILAALRTGGSVDLLGPIVGGNGTALVSAETRYFAEHWAAEIESGRFRVFGKRIQSTAETGESIDRKSVV